MKATLEFDINEDKFEFENYLKGPAALRALEEIHNEVFRPARKHGYSDHRIKDAIEQKLDAELLIGILENKFIEILRDHEINL